MNSVTKTCRLCGEVKPTADFHARKDSPDGFRNDCRACVLSRGKKYHRDNSQKLAAAARARHAANADAINAQRRASRASMTPEQRHAELERNRSWIARNRDRVRETKRLYEATDPERKRAWNRSWHERNREHVREYRRQQWLANKAEMRARGAAYRAANRDRLAAHQRAYYRANKQQVHAYQAAYRAANGDAIKRLSRVRYLRFKAGTFSTPPQHLVEAKWQYWGARCWMCGGEATTIDHVKPLSKGGSHLLANLRPACKPCNSSKHARWFGASKLSLFMRA